MAEESKGLVEWQEEDMKDCGVLKERKKKTVRVKRSGRIRRDSG